MRLVCGRHGFRFSASALFFSSESFGLWTLFGDFIIIVIMEISE